MPETALVRRPSATPMHAQSSPAKPERVVAQEFRRDRHQPKGRVYYPFWFGGSASCCAAFVTHPLDLVKVRLQTQNTTGPKRNMLQMFVHVFSEHGVLGLYKGLSASVLRQATYSTTRFGVYEALKNSVVSSSETGAQPPVATLILLSSVSGFLGGVAGNPADVLNVRMQHDAALPPGERRNYKHALNGLVRMAREEGVVTLWRGVWPNSFRAVLMTASQLASYDSFKRMLLDVPALGFKDDLVTHFSASLMAGFVATTVCSPVDVLKTRVMSASGQMSLLQLVADTTRQEGLKWMFRGWVPSFIRLGPHTIATFIFLEQHKKLYRKYIGVE